MSEEKERGGFSPEQKDISAYKPDYIYRRLSEITYDDICSWGVKAVGLDIDHTIFYDCTTVFIEHSGRWLRQMQRRGVRFVIITNAFADRAGLLSLFYRIPFVAMARKPAQNGYLKAAEKLGCKASEMAFVGDRLFTDVCGANAAGAVSVYVRPPMRDFLTFRHCNNREQEKQLLQLFESDSGEES